MGILDSIVGGGIGLLGDVASSLLARRSAEHQEHFQEEMSNTAYQRAVKDMQSAGLSPMLAYSQGGASTPHGAMYNPPPFGRSFTQGMAEVSSAGAAEAEAARTRAETQPPEVYEMRMEAEIARIKAAERESAANRSRILNEVEKVYEETRQERVHALIAERYGLPRSGAEMEILLRDVKRAHNEGEVDDSTFGQIMAYLDRLTKSIGGALGGFLGGAAGGLLGRGRGRSGGQGLRPPRMEWRAGGVVDRDTGQLFRP